MLTNVLVKGKEGVPEKKLSDYLTVAEAAEVLGVSAWTLRNWDNNGKLRTRRHPRNGYRLYRREDLDALLQDGGLRDRLYNRLAPTFDWTDAGGSGHLVQFYETDAFLAAAVSRFLGSALRAGEGAILIATPSHRRAVQRRLAARGLDVSAAHARGQFIALDAAETLARVAVRGVPDARRFRRIIGGAVARAAEGRPGVRAFGEMVSLLWDATGGQPTLRLEGLWNELAVSHPFALQCAYPMAGFGSERDAPAFGHICACHSRVIPSESYTALATEEERLRFVARLQQKARARRAANRIVGTL
jgi:excisionase family DNA binding protein